MRRMLLVTALLLLGAAREPCRAQSGSDSLEALEHLIDSASPAPTLGTTPPVTEVSPAPPAAGTPSIQHRHPVPHVHPEPHRHTSHDIFEPFGLDFMRRAMFAGILAGTVVTWLGVFVVLRRMVFVGIALSQVASAGVAFAVFFAIDPVPVALFATLLFSILSGLTRLRSDLSTESRIGLVYVMAGSLAVIFLSKSGSGEAEQLEMLQGSLLTVAPALVNKLMLMAAGVIAFHILGFQRLVAVSFDPLTAHVAGVRVWFWNLLFFLALGTGISVSIQTCGLLLVFGYLVVPASAGLLSGCRLPGVFAIALACEMISTVAGLWLAYELDWPPGPAIVVMMLAFLAAVRMTRRFLARETRPVHSED